MVEAAPDKDTAKPEATASAPAEPAGGIPIVGRTKGPFSYWILASSAIASQYIFEALDAIVKPTEKILARLKKPPETRSPLYFVISNLYAFAVGTLMVGITTLYAGRTYKDMKALYAEAIGNELGKPKDQVGLFDMFKSKNTLVRTTMKAFLFRNSIREGLSLTFFLPWNIFNKKKDDEKLYNVGVKGARGLIGGYLITDTLFREETLFEAMQRIVDQKINHHSDDPDSKLSYKDVLLWLERYKHSQNKSYRQPLLDTPEWQQEKLLAARIADLMNQAHGNLPNVEQSQFTFTRLVELMGNGFLDKFPESMGYVELARPPGGMKMVYAVSQAIARGKDPAAAFMRYGICLQNAEGPAPAAPPEPAATRFRDRVPPQPAMQETARTPMDFAAAPVNTTPSL